MPVAFLVASIVEAAAVHLLVPWPWLRAVLLVATGASIIATACWFAARAVHPHLVTSDTLTLRSGRATVLCVDRERIVRVVQTRRFDHTTQSIHDGRLHLPGPDGTVIDIDFDSPIPVETRGRGGIPQQEVTGASLHVDTPRDLCAELGRRH
ncbi:hypothetical protein A6F55_21110 [Prescottella equi]|nr:hypothetical protein A6F55_21110 [Prescottella equi]